MGGGDWRVTGASPACEALEQRRHAKEEGRSGRAAGENGGEAQSFTAASFASTRPTNSNGGRIQMTGAWS